MISKHCGQRLIRLTPDNGPGFNKLYHRWRCVVCHKLFKQHRRQPNK